MYPTYAGKVQGGKPVIIEKIVLPENADLLITVLDHVTPSIETKEQRQDKVVKRFMAALDPLNDGELRKKSRSSLPGVIFR